jgi:prepilin-type N-terminal cleavage/methylation domain-containing protein
MNNKGFSLIEMLVVVLIFTIVMGIAVGVFTTALKLQKYNLAYQQLLSQVSYAMEYMDRSIRMAVKENGAFGCIGAGQNYQNPGGVISSINFVDYKGQCQQFYLNGSQVRSRNTGISGNAILDLTSTDFTVTMLRFVISGDAAGSQPRVTIIMEIEAKTTVLPKPKIKIQTTVSQRNLNM